MTPAIMVAIEGVTLAFLLVMFTAYILLPRPKSLKKDGFFYSLAFTVLGVAFDLIAWVCELKPSSQVIQYTSNFFALVLTGFMISAFGYYIIDLLNEKRPFPKIAAHIVTGVNAVGVVITVIAGFCRDLFNIHPSPADPGIMVYDVGGFFYELPIIISTMSLVFLFGLVLRYAKLLGRKSIIVFTIYFLIPMLSNVIETRYDNIQLSLVASGVSFSIVYVMLQSSHMNDLLAHEKALNEISYVDKLTGLLNRRACDRDVALIRKEDNVNIVFCDLNGLKRVNDEKGHHAGDQFLIAFSQMITRYFPYDSVYRISGDEFIVVARNLSIEDFETRIAGLRKEISDNAGIAALGTITGTGDTIPMLVKEAEMKMYEDKKVFYRHNPAYRR